MFEHGFPSHWTFLDKLIWFRALGGGGASETVTGVSPLILANALAKPIKSLIQYGKCATSGGDIYCNNGKLVAVDDELPAGYKRITSIKFDGDFWYETGESLTGDDDVTMTLADTSTTGQNVFGSYNGTASGKVNFSLYIYGSSSTSSSYFRYGEQLVRPKLGSGERTITFGKSGTSGFATDVSVTPDTFETLANTYIGMLPNSSSPTYTGSIIGNILVGTRLKYIPCERQSDGAIGYYEAVKGTFIEPSGTGTPVKGSYDTSHETVVSVVGTPEVITISESGTQIQTATAVNLFATDNVADEQDIITGVVTRRTEVVISNGTITIQALAEPVIEQVTPQPLSTVDGNNTLSWVAEVSGKTMEVTYAKANGVWTTVKGYVTLSLPDAVGGKLKKLIQKAGVLRGGTNDVRCNNGTLEMLNLACIAEDNLDIGYIIDENGDETANSNSFVTNHFLSCPTNAKFTMRFSQTPYRFYVFEYDYQKNFLQRRSYNSFTTRNAVYITVHSDVRYIKWGCNFARSISYADVASIDFMLNSGLSVKDYVPFGTLFADGTPEEITVGEQTAHVENLLSFRSYNSVYTDYLDTQDIITGEIKRCTIIKVLSGMEDWSLARTASGYTEFVCDIPSTRKFAGGILPSDNRYTGFIGRQETLHSESVSIVYDEPVSHLYLVVNLSKITVEGLKSDLFSRYAQAHPLFLLIGCDDVVTEYVAPQPLTLVKGDNTITQVYYNNVQNRLEAEYLKVPTPPSESAIVGQAIVGQAVI